MSPRFTDRPNATPKRQGARTLRQSAFDAQLSRRQVEGLSGMGAGRKDRSFTSKRVLRIFLGLALMALFCGVIYFALWQAEFIGGRTIPDVVGWRSERAVSTIEEAGFMYVNTSEVETSEVQEGMVVSVDPEVGTRVDTQTIITVEVAVAPSD